jgi:hypothetical protein
MRYVNSKILILISLPLALAQTACSSRNSGHHVVISLPEGGFKGAVARVVTPAPTPTPTSSGGSSFPAPTLLSDFNCIGVMVTGESILPQPGMEACTANPDAVPGKLGLLVGLVPASGGSIDVMIPGGSARLIQLVGVQSEGTCPDLSTVIAESGSDTPSVKLGDPIAIGSVTADIFADQSVVIKAAFDPLSAKPLFECGHHGSGSAPTLSGLFLYPGGPTNGPLRVTGQASDVSDVKLYSDVDCATQIATNGMNYNGQRFAVATTGPIASFPVYAQGSKDSTVTPCLYAGQYDFDSNAPSITLMSPYPGQQFTAGDTTVALSGSCTGSGSIDVLSNAVKLVTCTCASGTFGGCNAPLGGVADGPGVLEVSYVYNGYTVRDGIFFTKDSLAPSVGMYGPANNTNISSSQWTSLYMYGQCGSIGTDNVIITAYSSAGKATLATVSCTASSWNAYVDISGFPDGPIQLSVTHFANSAPTHQTYTGVSINKLADPPSVSYVSPSSSLLKAGGELITVGGSGFKPGATVDFGGYPCTAVTFVDSNNLFCTSPSTVNASWSPIVRVTNPDTQYSAETVYIYYVP